MAHTALKHGIAWSCTVAQLLLKLSSQKEKARAPALHMPYILCTYSGLLLRTGTIVHAAVFNREYCSALDE